MCVPLKEIKFSMYNTFIKMSKWIASGNFDIKLMKTFFLALHCFSCD